MLSKNSDYIQVGDKANVLIAIVLPNSSGSYNYFINY